MDKMCPAHEVTGEPPIPTISRKGVALSHKTKRYMDVRRDGQKANGWKDGRSDNQTRTQTDGNTGRRKKGQLARQMDGQTDE